MKELPEGKGPGATPVEFTHAPIYEIDPSLYEAFKGGLWNFKLSELNRSMNMVHKAQLDALRAEMVRDEEPEV